MKKLFALKLSLSIIMVAILSISPSFSQNENASDTSESKTDTSAMAATDSAAVDTVAADDETTAAEEPEVVEADSPSDTEPQVKKSFHYILKEKFIEGGPVFMGIVLICLILGLAVAIERIIYLNLATTNSKKLLAKVEDALNSDGVEGAKEVVRDNSSPIASIFYQGLERWNEGIEMVEKSIISYGSVQTGLMEKGLSWISLFIALAPMLGFMGTVIGMIGAFDDIEAAGDISPSIVAGGIKVALLTTVFGLIVAIILQIFYNYLLAKVDGIVNNMEDASISFVDLLIKHNASK